MGVVFEARDTILDRTVALKLVRPDARLRGDKARARLLREGQALARLKHPNVVTVFEVGAAEDEIFIAMELVEGASLRDWMQAPHDWREIVDLFVAVGRGLAAAHALGLVHRDVKPSNVFLDGAGTPKVGDFGLVASAGALDEDVGDPAVTSSPLERTLTSTGSVMGTPAYMAPEQVHGERADARADQFAYCVSLYEALTGRLPGERERGATRTSRPVPRRLEPILARGMDPSPDARYPTMDALLADLTRARRGSARAWMTAAGVAGALAIAGGAWALAGARADAGDPCPPPTTEVDAVWGTARRAAVIDHVRAVDPVQGTSRVAVLAARVDPYVRAWREMHLDACRATRVRGAQSDTMLDLRMRCLDRRLAELGDGLALIAGATTPAALDRSIVGISELTPLDGCADATALAAAAPPPEQPAVRAKAETIAEVVQRVRARAHAGQLDGLTADAERAVADARALGHLPTLASALVALARVELATGDDGASSTLRELTQVAARAHDDRDEAFGWTKLIVIVGTDEGKRDEANALVAAANTAVLRAGDPVDLRAQLLYAEGQLLDDGPHAREGLTALDDARARLERAGATDPTSSLAPLYADIVFETASAKGHAGDTEGAVATYHRAIELDRTLFGPDTDDEAYAWHDLGEYLRIAGRLEESAAAFRTAIRIREARLGASINLARSDVGLATTLFDGKHYAEALELYSRALRMERALLRPDDPQIVGVMTGYALALSRAGRADEAAKVYDDAIATVDRTGARTTNLAIAVYNRGDLAASRGRCADALGDYTRATSLFEELSGKDSFRLAYPLVGEGNCLIALHRPADAIAPLERARALHLEGPAAAENALARFALGRALVESGRDPKGGLALARAARADLQGAAAEERAEIDRWLAAHR
jgi:tetratricopeptide (TPR) repeat protein/tRNA A-37 threonylcarbamoyl transferase component Bud32